MRYALLLFGIVGKVYYDKANFKADEDVDPKIAHHFYQKNIFDVNSNVDVFIHSWDVNYEDELTKLYKPKKKVFEKQITFDEDNVKRHSIESRWYSTLQVNNLKKEYEKENNFKYDAVMCSRFDVGIFKPFVFSKYEMNGLYLPKSGDDFNGRVLDYWYVGSSEHMDIVNSFHPLWASYGKKPPHDDLYRWPSENDIDIYLMSEFGESEQDNGNTDLIRAVYVNCQYNKEFVGEENLVKFKSYPRTARFQ